MTTLDIESLLLAEAVAEDASGVLTAVRINQNVLIAPQLPSRLKRVLIAIISGEALVTGATLQLELRVLAPDGSVVGGLTDSQMVGPKRYADLPAEAVLANEVQTNVMSHGAYRFELTARILGGPAMTRSKDVHVVESLPDAPRELQ